LIFTSSNIGWPSPVWSGSEFGLSWEDFRDGNQEIYFGRVSSGGAKIGSDVRITFNSSGSYNPSHVWTGREYAVTWEDVRSGDCEIYFARVSAGGEKIGADTRVTYNGYGGMTSWWPFLVWSGSEYGVTWIDTRDGNREIYFARLAPNGVKLGSDLRVTHTFADSYYPSMTWTGSEYALAWRDSQSGNYEIYLGRISAEGVKIGSETRISSTAAESDYASIAWTGSNFAVSWQEAQDGNNEIYLALIAASGSTVDSTTRITNSPGSSRLPVLAWTGSPINPEDPDLFALTWSDERDGNSEIYFSLLSPEARKIGADLRLSYNAQISDVSYLAWTGSEFGVTWRDYRSGFAQVYFTLVGLDLDGDGLDIPAETMAGTDPFDWDSDDDDLSDYEEVMLYGTDPNQADMDDDGLTDYEELFVYLSDPWFMDSDGDGLSDWSEVYVTLTSPALSDTDSDGVPDGMEVGNALTDRDGDGMPNGWESVNSCLSADTADAGGDADTDGLTNFEEYGAGSDPCEADTDGDGLDDHYELNVSLTSPTLPDTDGDGLNDGAEVNTHSTDPLDPDSDDDGYGDGAEVAAGSDPNDPNSIPAQPERLINYQGRLADNAGVAMGGTVTMRFQIFTSLSGSTVVWGETQDVHVVQGIYNVLLGNVNPLDPDAFAAAGKNVFFLQVSVNGEPMSLRQRIASVPQAIFADRLMNGRIETDGRTLMVSAPAASVTMRVSFNQAFAAPPRVWVSALNAPIGGRKFIDTIITNISATGFDVTFDSLDGQASSGSASFTYAAFGN
jgi:hypothetical protein